MARPEDPPPGVLADIAELVGDDAAERLAVALGGRDLYCVLARNVRAANALVGVLDADDARKVTERFTGETVYIPRARRWVARRMFDRGCGTTVVARTLGVSRSVARRYRKAV